MTTNRELLELAAKAAGIGVHWNPTLGMMFCNKVPVGRRDLEWNPLTDDGDALRLAVKLGLEVTVYLTRMEPFTQVTVRPDVCTKPTGPSFEEEHNNDPYAATRRAIVRAAAAIGKEIANGNGN